MRKNIAPGFCLELKRPSKMVRSSGQVFMVNTNHVAVNTLEHHSPQVWARSPDQTFLGKKCADLAFG